MFIEFHKNLIKFFSKNIKIKIDINVKDKKMTRKKTQSASPPFLTGGGGFNFEHTIGAYYLTFLLKKAIPRACEDLGIISKVSFQNQWAGFKVDDLCVYCKKDSIFISTYMDNSDDLTENIDKIIKIIKEL